MEKNPDSINLEWFHHMKCWKTFCDEGKIRRQQGKEEKGERTSSKGQRPNFYRSITSSRATLPQTNAHVLPEICMYYLWERHFLAWFSFDKVGGTLIGIYTVILALYGHVDVGRKN